MRAARRLSRYPESVLGRLTTTGTLLALGGLALAGGELVLAPAPDSEVTRRWSESLRLEVDSLDESLDGNAVDLPLGLIELAEQRSFAVDDTLARCEGGRPVELVRRYGGGALESSVTIDGQPVGTVTGASVLDGIAVRFRYDAEEDEILREAVEGSLDPALAERLALDLDLVDLLPRGAVEVDDAWTLEPDALRAFFAAGGDVGLQPAELRLDMSDAPVEVLLAGALASLHELFGPGAEISGEAEARYLGEDEDDAALARIEVALDLLATNDLGERYRRSFREATEDTHGLTLSAEVEGTLAVLWDRSAGHLRSARFEGDVALEGEVSFPLNPSGERELAFVGQYELSGEATLELDVD